MDAVFSWVKNIIVFFLVITLLEEILPDSDFKKYIRVAAGMVFILVVFSPLLKLFGVSGSMDYFFQWESFKSAIGKTAVSGDFDGEAVQSRKEAWILAQYKENLGEQIQLLVENEGYIVQAMTLSVDEDAQSDTFGSVLGISLDISPKAHTDGDAEDGSPDRTLSGKAGEKDEESGNGSGPDAGGNAAKAVEPVAPVIIDGQERETAAADAREENMREENAREENMQEEAAGEGGIQGEYAQTENIQGKAVQADEAALGAIKKLLAANYGISVNAITITITAEGGDYE